MEKKIVLYKKRVDELDLNSNNLKINSSVKLQEAKDFRTNLKSAVGIIKGERDERVKPIKEGLKKIEADYNPLIKKLIEIDYNIKGKMEDYVRSQQIKIEEKKEEIQKKVEKGEMSFEKAGKKIERVEDIKVKTRVDKVVKIVDESKIPHEYWLLNMVKINDDALGRKGFPIKIAGVKVEEKTIVIN